MSVGELERMWAPTSAAAHRVNLLIADDVGARKTVEAGLVLREMLLRRRVDFTPVAAPAGMVRQWQDELEAKFGLSFIIVDSEYLAARRDRGYGADPWTAGPLAAPANAVRGNAVTVSGVYHRATVRDGDLIRSLKLNVLAIALDHHTNAI